MVAKRSAWFAIGILVAAFAGVSCSPKPANAATFYSLWTNSDNPATVAAEDFNSVELGMKFKVSVPGKATAIKFYKNTQNTGTHKGNIWTASGNNLGSVVFTNETASGWQTAQLVQPITLTANTEYVVSYLAPNGRYAATNDYFTSELTNGPLTALADQNGVYSYGTGSFPNNSWKSSNYWVDVVFSPSVQDNPQDVAITAPDAGNDPYQGHLTTNSIPIGVWYEGTYSQADIDKDKAAGINTYVELTTSSNPDLIESQNMNMLHSNVNWTQGNGYLIADEPDMWAGAGDAEWTGNYPGQGEVCNPASAKCGYSVLDAVSNEFPSNKLHYANFGKGVMFWNTAEQASRFVNNYTDLVSVDTYWYTDNNICDNAEGPMIIQGSGPISPYTGKNNLTEAECRRASNYGTTVSKLRSKIVPAGSQPVWNLVEVGGPFSYNTVDSFIQPREVDAAVWHSFIAGARGVVYFNHTFGENTGCESQHVLREDSRIACGYDTIRSQVTATNTKVQLTASAINGSFADFNGLADGQLNTTGDVTASARWDGTNFWLLAGSTKGRGQGSSQATFSLPCLNNSSAEVLGENRTITLSNGNFNDSFADELTTHVYKFTSKGSCTP